MSNELTKDNNSKDLAKLELLWLLNLENGRVFPWTTLLSVKKGFVDCTEAGVPINPKDVPGDHPWIIEQTQGLADRISHAGKGVGMSADNIDHMVSDFGRQLTEDGNAKFKSLEYKHSKTLKLEESKSAAQTGAMVRIYNKIDRMCELAQKEIRTMVFDARIKQGLV